MKIYTIGTTRFNLPPTIDSSRPSLPGFPKCFLELSKAQEYLEYWKGLWNCIYQWPEPRTFEVVELELDAFPI